MSQFFPAPIVPPSGVAILAQVYKMGTAVIPAIATDTLLSPAQVREGLRHLTNRGFAELDKDGQTVRITDQGLRAFPVLAKSSHVFGTSFEHGSKMEAREDDIDSALDKSLAQLTE